MSIDVDAIAPSTPELEAVAIRRTGPILKEWARLLSIWGMTTLPEIRADGTPGEEREQAFGLRALVIAAYVQGARDAVAVAVTMEPARD